MNYAPAREWLAPDETSAPKTDWELLQLFVTDSDQDAFAGVVRHHVDLVYSAALRQVGRVDLAQDVSQVVFLLLARKARTFTPEIILAGWLIRATRFASANVMKSEIRHQRLEQRLSAESNESADDGAWEKIAPHVDDALARLNEKDRNAIALRFFENKSLRDVGAALNLTENAAKKRVARAMEKLRLFFKRRGVRMSSVALFGLLPLHTVQAAPVSATEAVLTSALQPSVVSPALRAALESTEALLGKQSHLGRLKSSALWCALIMALVGGFLLISARNPSVAPAPQNTLRVQRQFLQSGDGNGFVQLLDLRTPEERELGGVLKRVVRTQHRLKTALRSRFGPAADSVQFRFPLDAASEGDLARATVVQQGASATLTWARGTSLRFVFVNDQWKSEFFRPPGQSLRRVIAQYEKIAEAMDATAADVERGDSSLSHAQKSFTNRRR